jgi:beta-phosphoglucomutase-like phosphatase (HAD superfamily)
VAPYEGSVRYVKAAGLRRAVAASIEELFEVRVDGVVAEREHLKGKPAPDTCPAGARPLGLSAAEAAVVEDAPADGAAGRTGDLACVVGVDRAGEPSSCANMEPTWW